MSKTDFGKALCYFWFGVLLILVAMLSFKTDLKVSTATSVNLYLIVLEGLFTIIILTKKELKITWMMILGLSFLLSLFFSVQDIVGIIGYAMSGGDLYYNMLNLVHLGLMLDIITIVNVVALFRWDKMK